MTSSFSDLDARRLQSLDVAASYLEVVQEDLTGPLQEDVIELSSRYTSETDPNVRAGYWEQIRHTIRGLEGGISECEEFSEVFRSYARERFDRIWSALGFKERNAVIGDYKFQSFGDERIVRPNFLESRRAAWITTKRRIDYAFGDFSAEEKEKIAVRMVDSADVAFAMCEYVFAIDDYEGSKYPEVERLLETLIDAIRALVFPNNVEDKASLETTKEGSASKEIEEQEEVAEEAEDIEEETEVEEEADDEGSEETDEEDDEEEEVGGEVDEEEKRVSVSLTDFILSTNMPPQARNVPFRSILIFPIARRTFIAPRSVTLVKLRKSIRRELKNDITLG